MGMFPVGAATQYTKFRERLYVDAVSLRAADYLKCYAEEIRTFSMITGTDDIHKLSVDDLCTISRKITENIDIAHA